MPNAVKTDLENLLVLFDICRKLHLQDLKWEGAVGRETFDDF